MEGEVRRFRRFFEGKFPRKVPLRMLFLFHTMSKFDIPTVVKQIPRNECFFD